MWVGALSVRVIMWVGVRTSLSVVACVCDAVVWGGCARRVCARHVWGVCVLRCIKARPESRTANVTYIKKYSILNIVIAHFVLS